MKFILSGLALALLPTALGHSLVSRGQTCELSGRHGGKNKISSQTGLTLDQCLSKCEATNNCLSVQFAKSGTEKGYCNLFSVAAQAARNKDDSKDEWFFYDRECKSHPPLATTPKCGLLGRTGAFYQNMKVSTQQDCLNACNMDSKCQSWTWYIGKGSNCYLNNKAAEQARIDNGKNNYSFDRGCSAPKCGLVGRTGAFYQSKKVTTQQDCRDACDNDSKCQSWTWYTGKGKNCYLNNKVAEQARIDNGKLNYSYDLGCPV